MSNKYQNKREEIKQVGRKVIAAYGYYKTTLEDIASALGMKKNSLYHYFESKDALFKELIEDEASIHLKNQKEILESGKKAKEKLLESCSALIQFIYDRAKLHSITVTSFIEIQKVLDSFFPDFKIMQREHFKNILEEGIKSGEFVKHRTTELADDIAVLIQSVEHSYYINSDARFMHEIDFNQLKERIVRILKYVIKGITI